MTIFEDPSILSKDEMRIMAIEATLSNSSDIINSMVDIQFDMLGETKTSAEYEEIFATLEEVRNILNIKVKTNGS